MKSTLLGLGAAALLATSALAQDGTPSPSGEPGVASPAPAPAPTAAAVCCKAPQGTVVVVETIAMVSSRFLRTGDKFDLRLAEPLVVDGHLLAPAGATGEGEVIDSDRPGVGGKAAKLVLAARYFQYANIRVPLRGFHVALAGRDQVGTSLAVSVVVGLPGFFVQGGNVDVPAGTRATAKIAEDVVLPPVAPSPSPNQGNSR